MEVVLIVIAMICVIVVVMLIWAFMMFALRELSIVVRNLYWRSKTRKQRRKI